MIHTRKLVEEAESARRSSKMLMVFTVITVIFAPLTFLAGLFGVAAVEWDVNHQNLRQKTILVIIFVTSLGIVAPAIGWAFSYKLGQGAIKRWLAGWARGSEEGKREAPAESVDEAHVDETTRFQERLRGIRLRRRVRTARQEGGGEEV
jgi:hypothetical protein